MRGDCLATWLIMLGFIDLGWTRICRRPTSNVGLVYIYWGHRHWVFHIPHGSAHILIPMHADRVWPWTVKQSTIISWWDHRSSASLDSAIGTGFYKLLLVFAISYTLCMPKFYMPTLINHRNNSKTAPISLYFVRPSGWCSLLQRYF